MLPNIRFYPNIIVVTEKATRALQAVFGVGVGSGQEFQAACMAVDKGEKMKPFQCTGFGKMEILALVSPLPFANPPAGS